MTKINISIDDISPHPLSSIKVINQCYKLISEFPNIKFSLFIPIAYWRTIGNTSTKKPLYLHKYPEFCNSLKKLDSKNFELGYHGYYHGIPNVTNNDEFKQLTEKQTKEKIFLMEEEINKCNLKDNFKKIFRPPAWRLSDSAINVFQNNNFKLCLSKNPSPITNEVFYNKVIKNANYANSFPPLIPLEKIQGMNEMNIVYHACEWDKNYLNMTKVNELSKFLKNIDNKEFVFM